VRDAQLEQRLVERLELLEQRVMQRIDGLEALIRALPVGR
jgi:hypothetical protein